MPIYEYECAKCRKVHEIIQKFSDKPLKKCPDCGGTLTKLMSMNSFALKGAGWYTTDYKGKPATSASKANADTAQVAPTPEKSAKTDETAKPAKAADSTGSTAKPKSSG